MSVVPMPPSPGGGVKEQLSAQYGYLFQLAQQLNAILNAPSGQSRDRTDVSALARSARDDHQYDALRTMIVRTADAAGERMEQLSRRLETERLDGDGCLRAVEARQETAAGRFQSEQQARLRRLEQETDPRRDGCVQRGTIVCHDGQQAVYGTAVGAHLTTADEAGETAVSPVGLRAVFTPHKLGLWQDGAEIVRVTGRCLQADEAEIPALTAGPWRVETGDGLCVQWIGGVSDGNDS